MRLHALSATFVGLFFIVWAFGRRSMYARLQNVREDETTGSWPKAKMKIRSIALCVLLLMFATGAVLQLRQIMPEWVNHMRTRSDRNKAESVRAFLESKGLPVAHISWGSGSKSWKRFSLAGPQLKDISPLAELPIARLELINTQVTDLNPLNKSALRSLSLVGSTVSDMSPLGGTKIHFLNLIGTDVTNLEPLGQMPELKRVSLSRQQVMDNLDVLRELDLFVEEVQGGPAFRTSDPGWQQEYESADVNGTQPP
jgi:Leucine-rich repeat (LRR) protein